MTLAILFHKILQYKCPI